MDELSPLERNAIHCLRLLVQFIHNDSKDCSSASCVISHIHGISAQCDARNHHRFTIGCCRNNTSTAINRITATAIEDIYRCRSSFLNFHDSLRETEFWTILIIKNEAKPIVATNARRGIVEPV